MIRSRNKLAAEARALLERERPIPAQPAAVRARVLARARATMLAGAVSATPSANAPATASPARRTWWAAAAVVACVASAAAGAVAYRARTRDQPEPRPAHAARPFEVVPRVADPSQDPATPAPIPDPPAPPAPIAPASRRSRVATADSVREELRLLRRARVAVGRMDYAAALLPIGEHARRFPDGKLAEEREALRVKSLAGLGRTEQARRAAARFEARFPHSVLSPAVSRMPLAPP
jgi:hypothetical protein